MLIQEKIAIASALLAALVYLVRVTISKYRKSDTQSPCSGCGCGRAVQIPGRKE